jgi:hypothetical protein
MITPAAIPFVLFALPLGFILLLCALAALLRLKV